MIPVFDDPTIRDRLDKTARSWLGVLYKHLGRTRGGVDCAHFVGNVLVDLGILAKLEEHLYYARDWYVHGTEEVLLDGLRRHVREYGATGYAGVFVPLPLLKVMAGDVLCMKIYSPNVPCHHAALVLGDGKIIHCLEGKGVHISHYSHKWVERTHQCYRLYRLFRIL